MRLSGASVDNNDFPEIATAFSTVYNAPRLTASNRRCTVWSREPVLMASGGGKVWATFRLFSESLRTS
jgi:hypothetical protein